MRAHSGTRPIGVARPFARSGLKIKALNIVPTTAEVTLDASGWGPLWSDFNWKGWLVPAVQLAKARGANTVKMTGSGATGSYPSQSVFLARINQFLDYTWSQGMLVYWNFGSGDWGGNVTAAAPKLQAVAAVLEKYPHVIGLDVANEVGVNASAAKLSDIPGLVAAARSRTSLPITASLSVPNPSMFTDGRTERLASVVDYFDFHPYYGVGDPSPSDLDLFRRQRYYKPWLIGEIGQQASAGTSGQASRWNAIANIVRNAPGCAGAVGFSLTRFNSEDWGMYTEDMQTPRTQITNAFTTWPTA